VRRVVFGLSLLVASACGAGGDATPDAQSGDDALTERVCGQDPFAPNAVRGIDVSRHQETVDFAKVAAAASTELTSTMFDVGGRTRQARSIPGKITFVAARVSDGLAVKDGQLFQDNIRAIRAASLVPGAYQFLRPNEDAHAQAAYFIQELDRAGGYKRGDLPPTVDIEVSAGTTPQDVQAAVATWLGTVGDHYKVRPIVYSLAGVSSYLGSRFTSSPLWIANFYQSCPKMPAAWTKPGASIPWKMFQYDDAGHVDGIAPGHFVDLNVFNGTRADFDRFLDESYLGPR
jgi:lysozyme